MYEPTEPREGIASKFKIFLSYFTSAVLAFSWLYLAANPTKDLFGRGVFLGSLTVYIVFTYFFRSFVFQEIKKHEQKNRWLLICSESIAKIFMKDFHESATIGHIELLNTKSVDLDKVTVEQAIMQKWTGVIVEETAAAQFMQVLMQGKLKGISIYNLPDFYELYWGKLPVSSLDDTWFAFTKGFFIVHSDIRHRLKRVFDIGLAFILLVLLLPLVAVIWLIVRFTSRGKAIYKQKRVGWKGNIFTIYKFRSMHLGSEENGVQWAQVNDDRTTCIGKFLRKFRIDEIPQLINILKGDMSFIGPRPERPEFTSSLSKQIPFYELRHLVKPGLTGWAQVMYRYGSNEEDAKNKLEYELYYIKNHSLILDFKIILKTFSVVLFGAGR